MCIVRNNSTAIIQNFETTYGRFNTVTIITTQSYAKEIIIELRGYYLVVLARSAVNHL